MTPLALEMLVWFCTRESITDFPNVSCQPQRDTISEFHRNGIVDRPDNLSRVTDKGLAWLALIRETPMPVQLWVDPRTRPPA